MKEVIRIITISREIYQYGQVLSGLKPQETELINKVLNIIHDLHEESKKLSVVFLVNKETENPNEN